MSLAAIDDLEDAFDATRELLFPFDAGRWLRLAVVAFFVGGAGWAGSGGGGRGGNGGAGPGDLPPFLDAVDVTPPTLSGTTIAVLTAGILMLVLLALAAAVVAAIMEFVLVASLSEEAVHLRRYGRRYWRGGVRLFGFRLGVGVVGVVAVLAVVFAMLGLAGVFGHGDPGVVRPAVGLLVGVPVVLVVALAVALVLDLTTDFVVPVMLLEGTTVLAGWRRFWPTLRTEWHEYAVYVLVSFVLRLVVGVVVALAVGVVALVLLAPLGLVAVAGVLATGGQLGLGGWVGLGLLALVGLLVLAVVAAVIRVPVVTYFRYYALLVLGDTEPAFDLVADRRAAIRAEAPAD